jgi:indole-3-glycerol phosphate synthase
MILNDILVQKRKDLEELKTRFSIHRLKEATEHKERLDIRSFKKAVSKTTRLNLICEIKKASPSEGVLREDFQPLRIAGIYEHGGAAAISVLTESHYFKGRPSYLKTVRQVTSIPILRKDFIFESYQIYETALLEADAYLLIASILTEQELTSLIELGRSLKMDPLVEVHSDEDLKKAVGCGADIIGINNRDLKTLKVDPNNAKRLLRQIPKNMTVVVESGFTKHDELLEYKSLGIHSFLIGSALMKANDITTKLSDLMGTGKRYKHSEEEA